MPTRTAAVVSQWVCLLLFSLLGSCWTGHARAEEAALGKLQEFAAVDLAGKPCTSASLPQNRQVVLVFLNTTCPVANFYLPELARLQREFEPQQVTFIGVYPDPQITADAVEKHAAEYGIKMTLWLDAEQSLAQAVGVQRTPEVVLLAADGTLQYRGRIDDRFIAGGKRREVPRSRELQAALTAVVAGEVPAVRTAPVYGCPLPKRIAPSE